MTELPPETAAAAAAPARKGWPALLARLQSHRGKIVAVGLGQLATGLGLAVGSRVLTEFVAPEALGEYKLAIGIVGLFTGIFFRPFIQFVMRQYHDAAEHRQEREFLAFARSTIARFALVLGFALAVTLFFYGRNTPGLGLLAALLGGGLLYLHVSLSFQNGVLITQNRQRLANVLRTGYQCGTPFAVAAGAWALGQDGQFLLLAELVFLAVVFAVSVGVVRAAGATAGPPAAEPQRREWTGEATRFVVPMLGVSLFSWMLGVSDRFILAACHSAHEVGLYSAVYGLGSQPMLMVTGLTAQLVYPFLFKAAAQKRGAAETLILRYVIATAVLAAVLGLCGLLLFGNLIVELLLAAEYRTDALPLLLWVAAGYALLGVASSFELKAYAGKKTSVISTAYGVAAATNLGLNFLWIPHAGALGAARATCFGFLAYLLVMAAANRKVFAAATPSPKD